MIDNMYMMFLLNRVQKVSIQKKYVYIFLMANNSS